MAGEIVLLVDGKVVRDDNGVIAGLYTDGVRLQSTVQEIRLRMAEQQDALNMSVDRLIEVVNDYVADVRARLSEPVPDVAGAITRLDALSAAVATADTEVQPPPPPPEPEPTPGA
jgi:hypothetical protein